MKTIPLTVLVYDSPSARAYLSHLKLAGYRPERIVLLVLDHHPLTKKPYSKWMPGFIKEPYAERIQEIALNYWPRQLSKRYPMLVEEMIEKLESQYPATRQVAKEILEPSNYRELSDNFDAVSIKNLKSPALKDLLSSYGETTILFTGGGILPKSLIEIDGIRFIHFHPGFLPFVRGADGLLWSSLVRGKPGVSAFYMAPGIDTGHIIIARDCAPITFSLPADNRPEDQMLYRALFAFYDPIIRADALVNHVLPLGDDLANLPAQPQDPKTGITYHFLHSKIRSTGLKLLFKNQ